MLAWRVADTFAPINSVTVLLDASRALVPSDTAPVDRTRLNATDFEKALPRGGMPPGHHWSDATAVLGVVKCSLRDERPHEHALEWLRPRVPRGLRALTAPPRSANGGGYGMAA
jgi:hypothetical protein